MMRLIAIFCLICIFRFDGFSTNPAWQKADSLQQRGDFRLASLEYEKIIYQSFSEREKARALLQKAECLKALSAYQEAEENLNRAIFPTLGDSLSYQLKYQSALCAYMSGNFEASVAQLMQIEYFYSDSSMISESFLLYTLTLNEMRQWTEAKGKLQKWVRISSLTDAERTASLRMIDSLYAPDHLPKLKSQKKARHLSTFLPGTGQWYAGYPAEGIANVAFQLIALGFAGYSFYLEHYFTTFTLGTGLFQKFYMGAISRLEYLVDKKNYELSLNKNAELRSCIIPLYSVGK